MSIRVQRGPRVVPSRFLAAAHAAFRLGAKTVWATILPLILAIAVPLQADANPFVCNPQTSVFALSPASSHPVYTASEKKLSSSEFSSWQFITPSGAPRLSQGTELSVVVDTSCLRDFKRGARELRFLKDLAARPDIKNSKGRIYSHLWKLENDWDFAQLQDAFEREPCIEMASPDHRYELFSSFNDPFLRNQTHLRRVKLTQAFSAFLLPSMVQNKVVIAIIDTGIDFKHPDLKWNRWLNPKEIPGNGLDDDANGLIDDIDGYNFASNSNFTGPEGDWTGNIHGTHVAGLAAARFDNRTGSVGINGAAQLMSLNAFGSIRGSRSSILENSIRYAADQGASVINMSMGGPEYSRTLRGALEYAIKKGSLLISAAGNQGIEICDNPSNYDFVAPAVYAASLDGMISVASVDVVDGSVSAFSNYSRRLVEISAPGAYSSGRPGLGLLSTTPKGTYGYQSGTSMAAPLVSGAAALAISWLKAYGYPSGPPEIERILLASSRRDPSLSAYVQEGRTLDLSSLARYLKTHFPPRR